MQYKCYKRVVLGLYIFRRKKLRDDTSSFVNHGHAWECKNNNLMTYLLFKEFLYFFKKFVLGGMFFINHEMLHKTYPPPNLTQESMCLHNLISMSYLLIKYTKEKSH
jgi:hypothetical protein